MKTCRADLHVHTVLSPCGDLEMSPGNIIERAKKQKIDIIGITDHNTTRHCALIRELGKRNDIYVLTGAEVTTKEEVHCLAFFDKPESLEEFQRYLSLHLPFVQNDPLRFGHQVVVDEYENILEEIESLLIIALDQSIEEVRIRVHELNGLFIPAHVNRPRNGILSQLGIMPESLNPDAVEIWGRESKENFLAKHPDFRDYSLIRSSDAHYPDSIGKSCIRFVLNHISFDEITKAFRKEDGREVIIE